MSSKLCDSCKSATATLFCRADSAFLCMSCDSNIHAANKLASRHARVWVCEVCEQAPAHVTCKADAAALCVACDRDIHSANPLARRHERVAITPFFDTVSGVKQQPNGVLNFLEVDEGDDVSREEAEAESWLLPNPKVDPGPDTDPELNSGQFVFGDVDPYLDLEFGHVDPKIEDGHDQNSSGADGVVPVQSETVHHHGHGHGHAGNGTVNDQCFDLEFSKPFGAYSYNTQCLSQSVSSSSMEVGVVPDGSNTPTDVTNPFSNSINNGFDSSLHHVAPVSSVDREAKVMRYREKRKNRKFEKTIRYASRKAYAETRPRIKGRFAKRTDPEVDADRVYGYGVVPSF